LATGAQLNTPRGVRIFAPGTAQESLYFSDTGNNRIRRIRFIDGKYVIDTVAGDGQPGYSGDGGLAVNAKINDPEGLAFDSQGVLYIADRGNSVERAVSLDGLIHTVVGDGTYNFRGDGGPAHLASLEGPFDLAFNAVGDMFITDLYAHRIREVLTSSPTVQANPTSLDFTAPAGSHALQQAIMMTGSIPNFFFSDFVVASAATWLSVTPLAANAPGPIQVTADPTRLTPGQYHGTVEMVAPYGNPTIQQIPVTFTVTKAGSASVAVSPSSLQFQYVAGQAAASKTLNISNAGGGSLVLSVKASTNNGKWLSASAGSVRPSCGRRGAATSMLLWSGAWIAGAGPWPTSSGHCTSCRPSGSGLSL